MRDYGKLACEFWTSPTIQALSDDAKLLSAYLLTNHHCTLIGCYRLPDGYVCDDLGWGSERVAKGFSELLAKGFITRCEASKYVLIVNYLAWNPLENPNQRKAAEKLFEKLPDSLYGKGLLAKAIGVEYSEPLRNPSETLSKPVTVAVTGTVAETVSLTPAAPDSPPKTAAVWESYANAYADRHGVPPVRNAKVNGQLTAFLKRVSVDEAPHIAAYYVRHNNHFYVQKMHSVDCLLADAEKLRTEWATQTTMTSTQARQADRTQANGSVFGKLILEAANGD